MLSNYYYYLRRYAGDAHMRYCTENAYSECRLIDCSCHYFMVNSSMCMNIMVPGLLFITRHEIIIIILQCIKQCMVHGVDTKLAIMRTVHSLVVVYCVINNSIKRHKRFWFCRRNTHIVTLSINNYVINDDIIIISSQIFLEYNTYTYVLYTVLITMGL